MREKNEVSKNCEKGGFQHSNGKMRRILYLLDQDLALNYHIYAIYMNQIYNKCKVI